jgi:hypothetical protein
MRLAAPGEMPGIDRRLDRLAGFQQSAVDRGKPSHERGKPAPERGDVQRQGRQHVGFQERSQRGIHLQPGAQRTGRKSAISVNSPMVICLCHRTVSSKRAWQNRPANRYLREYRACADLPIEPGEERLCCA